MFPATITITIDSVDTILNRVNQDNFGSEYLLIDSAKKCSLKIRHSLEGVNSALQTKMARHNVFFEHITFPTLTTPEVVRSYTMTLRAPELSDPQIITKIGAGVQAWLATSTNLLQISSGVN